MQRNDLKLTAGCLIFKETRLAYISSSHFASYANGIKSLFAVVLDNMFEI